MFTFYLFLFVFTFYWWCYLQVNDAEVSPKALAKAALALGALTAVSRLTVFRPSGGNNDCEFNERIERYFLDRDTHYITGEVVNTVKH